MSAVDEVWLLAGDGVPPFLEATSRRGSREAAGWTRRARRRRRRRDARRRRQAAAARCSCYLCAPRPGRDRDDAGPSRGGGRRARPHGDARPRRRARRGAAAPRPADRLGHARAGLSRRATGDYLFARAFARARRDSATRAPCARSADGTLDLAQGEALQMRQARRARRRPRSTSSAAASRPAGCSPRPARSAAARRARRRRTLPRSRRYGRRLGLAFQIADDVLDCDGDPESTGKPIGTDLLDGTVTLPLLLAARPRAARRARRCASGAAARPTCSGCWRASPPAGAIDRGAPTRPRAYADAPRRARRARRAPRHPSAAGRRARRGRPGRLAARSTDEDGMASRSTPARRARRSPREGARRRAPRPRRRRRAARVRRPARRSASSPTPPAACGEARTRSSSSTTSTSTTRRSAA